MLLDQDFKVENYVFTTPVEVAPQQGLKMAAKCYQRTPLNRRASDTDTSSGLTMVFCHGLGAHKEQWEPTLIRLFDHERNEGRGHCTITEAWALDWQSHGDSAVLNGTALASQCHAVSLYDWAIALRSFINSPRMMHRQLVLIGHCVGMTALTLAISDKIIRPNINALIMVDPIIITEEVWQTDFENREAIMTHFFNETMTRPDTWTSRQEAYNYLIGRYPWRQWNKDVLEIFVEKGLQPTQNGGCTLKCNKAQEASQFLARQDHFDSTAQLLRLSQEIPTFIIWGETHDNIFFSKDMQDASLEPFKGYVSQMTVQGCGHMVIQEKPGRLASLIAAAVDKVTKTEVVVMRKAFNKL